MVDQFIKAIKAGIKYAMEERLVTFGIIPSSPETGYGYIKSKEPLNSSFLKGSHIESFIEKPNLTNAKKFLKDKRYNSNSGMFLFKANIILQELKNFVQIYIKIVKNQLLKIFMTWISKD